MKDTKVKKKVSISQHNLDVAKSQSAMEYLMTYGWAILLLAVTLITLYELGFLNGTSFSPRVQAGACEVFRPYGKGSTYDINLAGLCNGELPDYVLFSRGVGDYVQVYDSNMSKSDLNIVGNQITITAWVFVNGYPLHDIVDKEDQYGMKLDYNNQPHQCSPSNSLGLCLEWDTAEASNPGDWVGYSFPIPGASFDKWMFLAVSLNGTEKYWYANGQEIGNQIVSNSLTYISSNLTIGAVSTGYAALTYGNAEWFNGSIANVQIYNTSIGSSDIAALYNEGIGGAPIDLYNLVGWWPLNGNENDYSGNLNNGFVYNDVYSGTWINNYQIP